MQLEPPCGLHASSCARAHVTTCTSLFPCHRALVAWKIGAKAVAGATRQEGTASNEHNGVCARSACDSRLRNDRAGRSTGSEPPKRWRDTHGVRKVRDRRTPSREP